MFLNYASLKVSVKKLPGAIKVEIVGELSLLGTTTNKLLKKTESFSYDLKSDRCLLQVKDVIKFEENQVKIVKE